VALLHVRLTFGRGMRPADHGYRTWAPRRCGRRQRTGMPPWR